MSIAENVKKVMEQVEKAAVASGRKPEDVTLVAASKMNSAERVLEAKAAGIRVFGENRVQELVEKNAAGAYEGAGLHFIGHLQKNKVKQVVGVCDIIESADSKELIDQIAKKAVSLGICQDIFIEINIGKEESKSGIMAEQLDEILDYASGQTGIFVKGLMTIPPISENITEIRHYFEQMYKLYVDTGAKKYDNVSMQFLSMGMSADFEEAIRAGANIVRVGTGIFGHRQY